MQQHWKDEDSEVSECEGKLIALLRKVDLKDRLSDDLQGCGDFLGIDVGKKLGICTRKNTNSDETNNDGDYSDRRRGGVNQGG